VSQGVFLVFGNPRMLSRYSGIRALAAARGLAVSCIAPVPGGATPWAEALCDAGADVVMTERVGSHGDAFRRDELPLTVAWAFGR
jgi:hypothetical protein